MLSSSDTSNWTVRGATFALWALAAATAAYWGLKLAAAPAATAIAPAASRQPVTVDPMVVARLMGHVPGAAAPAEGPAAAAPLSSRFSLVGVVADRSQQGAALISVDGQPPRPYRVGSRVDEGLVLKSVQSRKAVLAGSADGPAVVTLDMPALQR